MIRPVLELNEFNPAVSRGVSIRCVRDSASGTGPAADSVPPFSVVNGLSLISATLDSDNGFGLSGIAGTPIPDATQGAAILVARDSLTETLDAVKDLLTAENAYQLVQGNYDRVAAVSLAQKDARVPPELEVLDTPRGSRVHVHAARDAAVRGGGPSSLRTRRRGRARAPPRALAEPAINDWLGGLLGRHPENVGCDVSWIADPKDDPAPHDTRFVTLESLAIQPADFVSLVPIDAKDLAGGSELEQRIARAYRQLLGLDNGTFVRIDFGAATAAVPGQMTIAELLPLARRARGLIGECRALNAQDFIPAAGGKATTVLIDNANPGGYLLDELRGRVNRGARCVDLARGCARWRVGAERHAGAHAGHGGRGRRCAVRRKARRRLRHARGGWRRFHGHREAERDVRRGRCLVARGHAARRRGLRHRRRLSARARLRR